MPNEYVWKIAPKEAPIIQKKCTRCDNTQFKCSNKFRINSNKKLSDVWLIYKCSKCSDTWNMEILARTKLNQSHMKLFALFQENSIDLAWKYAFDKATIRKNKVGMNANMEFDVINESLSILDSKQEWISVMICAKYDLPISIKKILQKNLKLSANRLERLYLNGAFIIDNDRNNDLSVKVRLKRTLQINMPLLMSSLNL